MKLPKLFKRAVNGKTLEWEIEVNGACFRTISGYTDGIKTTSEWTCCEPKNQGKKNATTAEEQALAEATAMHRKRIELGSFENINDIDTPVYFKPMLAHDYNDYKDKIKLPVAIQPKLDGVRCIVRADGMWSRNGKPIISAPHIFEALTPLFETNPDLILDGELYCDKTTAGFNTIISCVPVLLSPAPVPCKLIPFVRFLLVPAVTFCNVMSDARASVPAVSGSSQFLLAVRLVLFTVAMLVFPVVENTSPEVS